MVFWKSSLLPIYDLPNNPTFELNTIYFFIQSVCCLPNIVFLFSLNSWVLESEEIQWNVNTYTNIHWYMDMCPNNVSILQCSDWKKQSMQERERQRLRKRKRERLCTSGDTFIYIYLLEALFICMLSIILKLRSEIPCLFFFLPV